MRRSISAMLVFFHLTAFASAADFKLEQNAHGEKLITLSGPIKPGDEYKFASSSAGVPHATVLLRSAGGDVITSLFIGRTIHQRGYDTRVPSHQTCASGCAFIWLAGVRREMAISSQIGFHGAYTMVDGRYQISGYANALVGAYLQELGYSFNAMIFFTMEPPNKLAWIDDKTAAQIGLRYTVKNDDPLEIRTPVSEDMTGISNLRPGLNVELPLQAYTTLRGRGVESCKQACIDDDACKAINLFEDGSCALLQSSSMGFKHTGVMSWERNSE